MRGQVFEKYKGYQTNTASGAKKTMNCYRMCTSHSRTQFEANTAVNRGKRTVLKTLF